MIGFLFIAPPSMDSCLSALDKIVVAEAENSGTLTLRRTNFVDVALARKA